MVRRKRTQGLRCLITEDQISHPEKINFELLEKTICTLARFLKIEENSSGIERLVKMLYKIKSKIDSNCIDILNLKAVFITFSINKDFPLKYTSDTLSFYVSVIIKTN